MLDSIGLQDRKAMEKDRIGQGETKNRSKTNGEYSEDSRDHQEEDHAKRRPQSQQDG